MPDIQEQLRLAQAKVKALSSRRDQVIRDAGIEEQKLQHLYESLRQLGVNDPEALSEDKLRELVALTQKDLEENLRGLADALAKGEALLKEYESLQQGV